MMILGNSNIGKVYKFGLMATGFASGATQDFETDYDIKAAKKFLKNQENMTETVDCMFRFNEKYAKSMSSKKYKKIAAICILQGVEFDGCPYWNKKVEEAKKTFVKSTAQENVTEDAKTEDVKSEKSSTKENATVKTEQKTENEKKDQQVEDEKKDQQDASEEKKEDFNAPVVIEPIKTSETQQGEKFVDVSPEEVTEVVEFDTDSKFIPKPDETDGKKNAIFDFDKMDVDLNASGKPTEKYKKAYNKINEVVKAQKPATTKYKLTQLPSGLIELQLMTSTGSFIGTTLFDPYIVYGNRIYMQANSEVGGVVVPLERYDLINKYLSGYTLTAQEAQECRSLLFFNDNIYINIDMSDIKEFRKMTTDNYRLLGAKLEKILMLLQSKMEEVPRFRFEEYQSNNKFTLVADNLVKNPNNFPIAAPKEKIEVKIMGSTVAITKGGETNKFKIN